MIKLIASDLDGTLLKEGTMDINPEIYDIIRKLKAKGIVFAAVSGREYDSIERVFAPVKDDIYFIAGNGGIISYQGEIIEKWQFLQIYQRGCGVCESQEGASFMTAGSAQAYVERADQAFVKKLREGYKLHVNEVDDVLNAPETMTKVAMYNEEVDAAVGAEEAKRRFGDKIQIMASGVVIPTAYLPELFGKIGTFFPLTFWDSYYLKLLFFGIKGQETRQLILMFAVFFAASVLWAKAAGNFGNAERREHKKGGRLTIGGVGKSAFFHWYFLQLKAWLKRGTSLLLLVSMLFVVWFAGQISMPQSDNVTVGIVETDGAHGKEVLQHLTQRESLFSFVMYDSKEALQEDVIGRKNWSVVFISPTILKKI